MMGCNKGHIRKDYIKRTEGRGEMDNSRTDIGGVNLDGSHGINGLSTLMP